MNLGVDFGSTYSMLSCFHPGSNSVQPIMTQNGSKQIPSVACFNLDDDLISGAEAKEYVIGKPDVQLYRAFKMLLPETDGQKLESRGYTPENNPRKIAKQFLQQQFEIAKECCDVERFENLVICVPQVWDKGLSTMSGKAILRDMCRDLQVADKVRVVSEPAAASAYFVHNYQKNTHKPYDGHILIVDYGGGTLDISLVEVNGVLGDKGSQTMEIDVLKQTGAGENLCKKVGNAGIAYMEAVVEKALKAKGLEMPEQNGYLVSALNELERRLINEAQKLRKRESKQYRTSISKMGEDEEIFLTTSYQGIKLPITYAMLYETFKEEIEPVLEEQLDLMTRTELEKRGLFSKEPDFETDGGRSFKIAVVGGFGQFFLVQRFVRDYFRIPTNTVDERLSNLLPNEGNYMGQSSEAGKEDAVCFGAALIADGAVTLRRSAKLSMGIVCTYDGRESFEYAIQYHQELEYGAIYYTDIDFYYGGAKFQGNEPIWKLAVGNDTDVSKAYPLVPLPNKQVTLEGIPVGVNTYGFSVDDSDVYTIHIVPRSEDGSRDESRMVSIPLGNFSDIFGANVAMPKDRIIYKNKK